MSEWVIGTRYNLILPFRSFQDHFSATNTVIGIMHHTVHSEGIGKNVSILKQIQLNCRKSMSTVMGIWMQNFFKVKELCSQTSTSASWEGGKWCPLRFVNTYHLIAFSPFKTINDIHGSKSIFFLSKARNISSVFLLIAEHFFFFSSENVAKKTSQYFSSW